MSNINDYLSWRGDVPITKETPFNEVDSMIMARFSYLIFDRIEMNEEETIKTISSKMKKFKNEEFHFNGDKELITKLGQSARFKNMKVTDYIENNEKENEKQFAAVVIHIDKNEMYVSYIGTNAFIYGWKEDFNLAYMENIPCQIEGKSYLKKVAEKYKDKKIRIGGHSKGGNVAIYSAITTNENIKKRIIKVYNYDGPGFKEEFISKYENEDIINKVETYFPQDSIIGRILNHKEKCSIIYSNAKGIMQHDIYSWQVFGTKPEYEKKLTNASEIMNITVTTWLDNTTDEQRKIFFDTIFELLYSTEANTFGEISNNLSKSLAAIHKKYSQISKEDKQMITNVVKIFVKTYFKQFIPQKREIKIDLHLPKTGHLGLQK